jgi:hypothetical protein
MIDLRVSDEALAGLKLSSCKICGWGGQNIKRKFKPRLYKVTENGFCFGEITVSCLNGCEPELNAHIYASVDHDYYKMVLLFNVEVGIIWLPVIADTWNKRHGSEGGMR